MNKKLVVIFPDEFTDYIDSVIQTYTENKMSNNEIIKEIISKVETLTKQHFSHKTLGYNDDLEKHYNELCTITGDILLIQDSDGNTVFSNNPDAAFNLLLEENNDISGTSKRNYRFRKESDIYSHEIFNRKLNKHFTVTSRYINNLSENRIITVIRETTGKRELETQLRWHMDSVKHHQKIALKAVSCHSMEDLSDYILKEIQDFLSPDFFVVYWTDNTDKYYFRISNTLPEAEFNKDQISNLSRYLNEKSGSFTNTYSMQEIDLPPILKTQEFEEIYHLKHTEGRSGIYFCRKNNKPGYLEKLFLEQLCNLHGEYYYSKYCFTSNPEEKSDNRHTTQKIINSPRFGFLMIDRNFQIFDYNEKLLKILKTDSINDLNIQSFIQEKLAGIITKCFENTASYRIAVPFKKPGLAQIPLLLQIYSVSTEQNPNSVLILLDKDNNESNLNSGHNDYPEKQKFELIGNIAAGIAHDFNNLITVINGNIDISEMDIEPGHPIQESLSEIRSATYKAKALAYKLTNLTRRHEFKPYHVNIVEVVKDSLSNINSILGEHISVKTFFPQEALIIECDPVQIDQILLNMLINARDAIKNSGNIEIEISSVILDRVFSTVSGDLDPGRYATVGVIDDGEGIKENIMENIFDPYFTTKPSGAGTGIGLSSTLQIMKIHNAGLTVNSVPKIKTEFMLYFKLAGDVFSPSRELDTVNIGQKGNEVILIVEDEEIVRRINRKILSKHGYAILEAENGISALEIYHKMRGKISLVITDIIMPMMNGYELARIIKEDNPQMKIIFTTGYGADFVKNSGISHDDSEILLKKPYVTDVLLSTVRSCLDKEEV
ncbi:MAG: response regulator [Deltaproteobacteria bacterium]|nr:response regulator [Deltaproteobacteria bacterium]